MCLLNHFLIREGRYYSHVCVLHREAPALEKGAHLTDLHLSDKVAGSCEVELIRAIISSSGPASLAFSSSLLFSSAFLCLMIEALNSTT